MKLERYKDTQNMTCWGRILFDSEQEASLFIDYCILLDVKQAEFWMPGYEEFVKERIWTIEDLLDSFQEGNKWSINVYSTEIPFVETFLETFEK